MVYKMDSDLDGDLTRRFVHNVLTQKDHYPDDDVDLAKNIKKVLDQKQKLIEALEKISNNEKNSLDGYCHWEGCNSLKIAQQALDEVQSNSS